MRWRRAVWTSLAAATLWSLDHTARAELPSQPTVVGSELLTVTLKSVNGRASDSGRLVRWDDLSGIALEPGAWELGFVAPGSVRAALIPPCAGRKRILVGQSARTVAAGPVIVDLPRDGVDHEVTIELAISGYEHRVACGERPRLGIRDDGRRDGLVPISFDSPHAAEGGGHAVAYIPPGHDLRVPAMLLVGLHPWSGNPWTYAAYDTLLTAARAEDVVLLFPSGLGNSLYTAAAEDEVLRALAALASNVRVDPARITLWGASMGGAGATTIGLHHPDLFAAVVSLFGDSKYDLSTYVHALLRDEQGAHRVNALDIVDNARNLPVWLIHGEDDHVSSIQQSAMLARALTAMHFPVTFDQVPGAGHEGRVVSLFASRIVQLAKRAQRVDAPRRVTYWSVRPGDDEAYAIRLTRASARGDAFFDLERVDDGLHLRRATNVQSILLPRGAFGFPPTTTPAVISDDPTARNVGVTWDAAP